MFPLRFLLLGFATFLSSCVDQHDAVVRTAAGAAIPWTCPGDATEVTETTDARYRLTGCGQIAVYECNFAFQPPRCWR